MKRRTFLTLTAVTPLAACFRSEQIVLNGTTMGTSYTVKYSPARTGVSAPVMQTGIDQLLTAINRSMSTYDAQSELSRFNQAGHTDWIAASADLTRVLGQARQISQLSSGAFDVSVGPLVNLWGFGPEQHAETIPGASELAHSRARIGYERLHIDPAQQAIRKDHPDLYIDLSGIAKGFGVDKVAEYLETQGVTDYLVEIGGEMRSRGINQDGQAWRIAIEEPTPGPRRIRKIIQLSGQSIATSGNYRNFFERNGQRYSHMIDPTTAWPIKHELALVSVISDQVMHADALSTALMVAGPERGYQLAQAQNLAALFISVDGSERFTHAFRQYLA